MFTQLRKLLGLQPPLSGLEGLLEQVRDNNIGVDDAAEQIRNLAAEPSIPPWFPRVFRLMGATFAFFGLCFGSYSVYFSIGTQETPGTVIQMAGGMQQAPIVEYAVNGKKYKFQSSMSSSPPAYTVGDKVRMIYDPKNPGSAQINSFHDRWFFPVVFTVVGLMGFATSFAMPRMIKFMTGAA